jgi:hypothetical protein
MAGPLSACVALLAGGTLIRVRPFDISPREHPDARRFARDELEWERCQATIAALTQRCFGRAIQLGYDADLTVQLAQRCVFVDAVDPDRSAAARTEERCGRFANVNVCVGEFGTALPAGCFDLIALCGCGHYFAPKTLANLALQMATQLQLGGELIAVHSLNSLAPALLNGDVVHNLLDVNLPLEWTRGVYHTGYRIDIWRKW